MSSEDLLRDWTLDDCPIMSRVMFSGARCLEPVSLPHAQPAPATEGAKESARRSTLPLHFTPADVPTTNTNTNTAPRPPTWSRKSGNELWGYGDHGRGFAPELHATSLPAAHRAAGMVRDAQRGEPAAAAVTFGR